MACSLLNSLDKEENGPFAGAASLTYSPCKSKRFAAGAGARNKDKKRFTPQGILPRKGQK
jgi:hypothetical protein